MKFEKLTAYLDHLQEREHIPGADVRVNVNHREVFAHSTGFSDAQGTRPVSRTDTYWIYSATKLITMVAILQLAESGKLTIEDAITDFIPTFRYVRVKDGIGTHEAIVKPAIRHFMSMSGGTDYDFSRPEIQKVIRESGGKATTMDIALAIGREPLNFEPGTHFAYSMAHDVLGAVVEAASGERFGTYVQEHIFAPLGMTHSAFQATEEIAKEFVAQYRWNEQTQTNEEIPMTNSFILTPQFESGGAGLATTVDDYALFADALACSGVGRSGNRILTEDSIDTMRTNQLSGQQLDEFHNTSNKDGYGYGLGVRTKIFKNGYNSKISPVGEFGWDGAAGAYVLIDPENRLSIFYAQQILGCGHAYQRVHPAIRDLVYDALDIR